MVPDHGRGPVQAWWDEPALPKFNTDHPQVREYLLGVAEHWLRFGIDGWRLDVPTEIGDPAFWAEFRRRCRAINPDAYLVGEIWDVAPEWLAGDRFDGLMNYPLAAALLGFAGGSHLDQVTLESHHRYRETIRALSGSEFGEAVERLARSYAPEVTAAQLNLIGSHDTPRALTVLGRDLRAMRIATLLELVLPGAPCIYYGDEIGMEGGADPDCRRAYPAGPEAGDRELRAFVRAVIAARYANPALRRGGVRVLTARDRAVALLREAEDQRAIVAVNAGDAQETVDIDIEPNGSEWQVLALPGWIAPHAEELGSGGRLTLTIPAQQALILLADRAAPGA